MDIFTILILALLIFLIVDKFVIYSNKNNKDNKKNVKFDYQDVLYSRLASIPRWFYPVHNEESRRRVIDDDLQRPVKTFYGTGKYGFQQVGYLVSDDDSIESRYLKLYGTRSYEGITDKYKYYVTFNDKNQNVIKFDVWKDNKERNFRQIFDGDKLKVPTFGDIEFTVHLHDADF